MNNGHTNNIKCFFLLYFIFKKIYPASFLSAVELVVQVPSRVAQLPYRVAQLLSRVAQLPYRVAHLPYRVAQLPYRVAQLLYRVAQLRPGLLSCL